jgi:hypothetical protein
LWKYVDWFFRNVLYDTLDGWLIFQLASPRRLNGSLTLLCVMWAHNLLDVDLWAAWKTGITEQFIYCWRSAYIPRTGSHRPAKFEGFRI